LTGVAAFDIYDISDAVNSTLELEPTAPINNKLEVIGFETQWFINNVGFFFIYILIIVAATALYLLIRLFNAATGRGQRARKMLS